MRLRRVSHFKQTGSAVPQKQEELLRDRVGLPLLPILLRDRAAVGRVGLLVAVANLSLPSLALIG